MKVTTHLRNQLTAAIDHGISAELWSHQITDEVLRVIAVHEDCRYCNGRMRASLRKGRKLIIGSAEGTRMKGLWRIPADRREAAVREMVRRAK